MIIRSLFIGAPLGALALLAHATTAGAQTGNVALAEVLFRDAKVLLQKNDYTHACPKLADSFRLDPATGTLLALAICHEREGKIASAWSEYGEVAWRAQREGRSDREKAAREKVSALETSLSTITIVASTETENTAGLELKQDGIVLGAGSLGTAVPVDGGPHVVEVSAPGKQPWRAKVDVAPSGEKRTVVIPPLEDSAPSGPRAGSSRAAAKVDPPDQTKPSAEDAPESQATEPTPSAAEPERTSGPSFLRVAGVVTAGAGIAAIGVGTFFGVQAFRKNDDSAAGCNGDVCAPTGKQDRLDAISAAHNSTLAFVGGGVLAAAGVTMYLLGRPSHSTQGSQPVRIATSPSIEGHGVGATLKVMF
jgi:hypothetical protein